MSGSRRDRFYRPQLEALEDRELLAASVFLRSGILTIRGTNGADTVLVTPSGSSVRVRVANGAVIDRVFAASQVNRISFRGFRGDDVFINNTAIPSVAFGDQGNDLLQGGAGIDNLFGGSGNDQLIGDVGDLLNGGTGRNRIIRGNTLPVFPGSTALTPTLTTLTPPGALTTITTSLATLGGLGSPIATAAGVSTLFGGTGGALAATSPAIAFGSPIGTFGGTPATSPLLSPTFAGTVSALGSPLTTAALASMPFGGTLGL
jgi:Ca2+-binding RTX toxin-like protein